MHPDYQLLTTCQGLFIGLVSVCGLASRGDRAAGK